MVRRRRWRCPGRRGRPLSCVYVADAGSWAVLSAMWAAVTVMWVVRTAAWAAGTAAWAAGWWILCFGDGLTFPLPTMAGTRPTGTVPTVLWSRGRRGTWSAAWFQSFRGQHLGQPAARGRTRSLNRGWVCARRRGRRSQKTCAAQTKGGGGWYTTLGLICCRRLRAVGGLAAHSNYVEGHCILRQYPP